MTERRFFSSAGSSSSTPGPRQRSWAEVYAVSPLESWSSSESDRSGNEHSPDQSNIVDQDPPVSSSSSSPRASPSNSNLRDHSSSSSSSPRAFLSNTNHRSHSSFSSESVSTERRVFCISTAQSTSLTSPANITTANAAAGPSTSRIHSQDHSQDHSCSCSWTSGMCQRTSRPQSSRSRVMARFCVRRNHHGRRLWGHLPVAIPPDRWYTGVGSMVCAQCRSQRYRHRTSWMCLECQVPLCLLTWRNCYSQWHSGE